MYGFLAYTALRHVLTPADVPIDLYAPGVFEVDGIAYIDPRAVTSIAPDAGITSILAEGADWHSRLYAQEPVAELMQRLQQAMAERDPMVNIRPEGSNAHRSYLRYDCIDAAIVAPDGRLTLQTDQVVYQIEPDEGAEAVLAELTAKRRLLG